MPARGHGGATTLYRGGNRGPGRCVGGGRLLGGDTTHGVALRRRKSFFFLVFLNFHIFFYKYTHSFHYFHTIPISTLLNFSLLHIQKMDSDEEYQQLIDGAFDAVVEEQWEVEEEAEQGRRQRSLARSIIGGQSAVTMLGPTNG